MRRSDTIVKHYFEIKYLGYHTTEFLLAQFGLRSRYRTNKVANFRVFILKLLTLNILLKLWYLLKVSLNRFNYHISPSQSQYIKYFWQSNFSHEKFSIKNKFSAPNISKYGTSKNDLKTTLGTLNQKIWAVQVFSPISIVTKIKFQPEIKDHIINFWSLKKIMQFEFQPEKYWILNNFSRK